MNAEELLAELDAYRPVDEADARNRARIRTFVTCEPRWFDRRLPSGHVTGSAWVVGPCGRTAALLHHRKLDRRLQPGGHIEPGDRNVRATALREAREELGLSNLAPPTGGIYDLDVHEIPARGEEPAHLHYDIRYAIRAGAADVPASNEESSDARFLPFEEIAGYPIDDSIRRLVAKSAML